MTSVSRPRGRQTGWLGAILRWSPQRQPALWLGIAATFALVAAGLPIAFASMEGAGSAPTTLAGAPTGLSAVIARHERETDVLVLRRLSDGNERVVAQVPHLPDHAVRAAVSPLGAMVAVVAPDGGSVSRPVGTLKLVTLPEGEISTAMISVDPLSTPVWRPDGAAVIVRALPTEDGTVTLHEVPVDGRPGQVRARFEDILGAYPVGFDAGGRLLVVLIDGRGSTLVREDGASWELAQGVTRDWELSPDGSVLAYIEDSHDDGLVFKARIQPLDGLASAAAAVDVPGQQLGVAWRPGGAAPTFGFDPGTAGSQAAAAASRKDGFDIPIAYSPDGQVLAVEAWSGGSFAQRKDADLGFITASGRVALEGAMRFVGWSGR
ncbi:MAG: hypothetical protein ACKVVT_04900 [Dehalococcoidia bacterium]